MASSLIRRALQYAGLLALLASDGFGQGAKPSRALALQATLTVSGVVVDPSDAIISGASVILSSGDRNLAETKSDERGEFHLEAVASGHYELKVGYAGFKTQRTRLNLGTRAPGSLRIALAIADLQETLKVEAGDGRLSLDPSEGGDVIRLDPRDLEGLPVMDGDIISVLTRMLDPSSIGTGGPTVIVDGLPSSGRHIAVSEIAEVRINSNAYSAEYARPGRGRIEIITKSGSSSYHGSLSLGLRDYHLDARNAFAVERPPERRSQLDASFSGPIRKGKNKDTFSLSFTHTEDDKERTIYGVDLGGPIRENAAQVQASTYFSAQFTRLIEKNALSFRYSASDWRSNGQGGGAFTLPGSTFDSVARYHHFYTSYRAVLTAKLLNEVYAKVQTEETTSRSNLMGVPRVVVQDAFTSGGAQVNSTGTDNRIEFTDLLSWSHGRQFLKAGVNVPVFGRLGSNDRSNFDGSFYFSSLADYAQGRPYSFTKQAGNSGLVFWQKQVAGFVQDEIKVRSNLSIAAGLRYEWQNYLADHKNFAPRLSLAYAPGKARKLVLRAGGGFFYDTLTAGAISDMLRLDGRRLSQIQLLNPSYPDPISATTSITALPPNLVRFSPNLRSPYTFQYSVGVERQLSKSLTLNTTLIGIRGVSLFRSRDVNAPLPPFYDLRPDQSLGVIRQVESSAGLDTHALETTLQGRLGRYFKGMVVYELRRAMNDTNGIGSFPANNRDLSGEWSRASFDRRHYVYLYGTINAGKLASFGVIFSAGTGHPYTMTTGHDDYHDGMLNARPPGVPRNSLQETGSATLDLRWSRDFSLLPRRKEGPRLAASVDAFNLFNRVNYNSFVGNLSSPFLGQPVAADPARRMQVSLAVKF